MCLLHGPAVATLAVPPLWSSGEDQLGIRGWRGERMRGPGLEADSRGSGL